MSNSLPLSATEQDQNMSDRKQSDRIKIFTWIAFLVLLFTSVFFANANLTNQHVAIATMLLLLALFSDLKEFDFWGLKGKRTEKELKQLEGGQALPSKQAKVSKEK